MIFYTLLRVSILAAGYYFQLPTLLTGATALGASVLTKTITNSVGTYFTNIRELGTNIETISEDIAALREAQRLAGINTALLEEVRSLQAISVQIQPVGDSLITANLQELSARLDGALVNIDTTLGSLSSQAAQSRELNQELIGLIGSVKTLLEDMLLANV